MLFVKGNFQSDYKGLFIVLRCRYIDCVAVLNRVALQCQYINHILPHLTTFQVQMNSIYHYCNRPIPGKVKLLLISEKKSASLLDHISRFLSHQFVTWYLRSISKTKIVKLFCPCMSKHMIYIKKVTNVTQTLHQNVTNVTKQNIASKEILTIEFHTKYMKLFVNMVSVICVLLNTKFHNTSENFYFEVILSRTIVSCIVTNVTNRYMDFILDLDEEFNFQRPVHLDSNRMHYYQSKIC